MIVTKNSCCPCSPLYNDKRAQVPGLQIPEWTLKVLLSSQWFLGNSPCTWNIETFLVCVCACLHMKMNTLRDMHMHTHVYMGVVAEGQPQVFPQVTYILLSEI